LKNVFEAADTRQKQAKKRSLCVIKEHFEPVFNTVAATQIVFQRPANEDCVEMVAFSEQYNFAISILLLEKSSSINQEYLDNEK